MSVEALYRITCTVDGMVYHGIASDVQGRWQQHRSGSSNIPLRRAMERHGTDAFAFEVIATGSHAAMRKRELELICATGIWPKSYNVDDGRWPPRAAPKSPERIVRDARVEANEAKFQRVLSALGVADYRSK